MTTFTTNFSWPKPAGTDAPDGPTQIGALADAIDASMFPKVPYLARQTLGVLTPTVTFSSIPSNLRRLTIRHTARTDVAVQISGVTLRINGDTGTNYNYQVIAGLGSTAPTSTPLAAQTTGSAGVAVGASGPAGAYGLGTIEIIGWDNPHTGFLQWTWLAGTLGNGTANYMHHTGNGQYVGTFAARTSVTLLPDTGNFVAGSDFQLEGWPT